MSELAPQPVPNESLRIHDQELAYLGALVTEAAMRSDLAGVAQAHAELTGTPNPNDIPKGRGMHIGSAEVPMSSEHAYRQVHTEAIGDLALSGVVRNPVTAGVKEQTRWGHRVFWNNGEAGKNTALGGRMVIEADKQAAHSGWVTADKVRGIYARDVDGQVKNILPS